MSPAADVLFTAIKSARMEARGGDLAVAMGMLVSAVHDVGFQRAKQVLSDAEATGLEQYINQALYADFFPRLVK